MIIPPDPEKDPNLFTPADSTPSLLLPTLDGDIGLPDPAHPHSRQAYGYPYGEWSSEQLPPYERKRASREGDVFSDSQEMRERSPPPRPRSHPAIGNILRDTRAGSPAPLDTLLPVASASTSSLPSPVTTLADNNASTSKIWEGTDSPVKEGRRKKVKNALTPAPDIRDCFTRYRKWIIGVVTAILVGLGLMTGLLVGLRVGVDKDSSDSARSYSPWHDIDGKKANTQWAPDGSLNLTYSASRVSCTQRFLHVIADHLGWSRCFRRQCLAVQRIYSRQHYRVLAPFDSISRSNTIRFDIHLPSVQLV
jgi:hypothetical protein